MLDFLDTIFESIRVYERHGIKGCLLVVGILVLIFGVVIAFAYWV